MSLLRLLNAQGIAGIAVSLALGILLLVQNGETNHWKTQSTHFEQLYGQEQSALTDTVVNYRAAAEAARAADRANIVHVTAQQRAISERTANDFEARLAAAHSRAQRLREQTASASADPGRGRAADMPGVSAAAGGIAQGASENGLPDPDRELATEQAIQLDELIKWIRAQAQVDRTTDPAVETVLDTR